MARPSGGSFEARIGLKSNAGRQLLPEAGAQRTLEAVSCTPWLGLIPSVLFLIEGETWRIIIPQVLYRTLSQGILK
jgi:hypothetical protein